MSKVITKSQKVLGGFKRLKKRPVIDICIGSMGLNALIRAIYDSVMAFFDDH